MKAAGCVVTSLAMLLRHHKVIANSDVNAFNPWICNEELKKVGAFTKSADLTWADVNKAYLGFELVDYRTPYSFSTIERLYREGYACIINVGGHYVALKDVTGTTVNIMDPGYSNRPTLASYSNPKEIIYYKVTPAKTELKTGDIIEFGSYSGETITWICVDVDENGPLMLSENVICSKQYDAAGTDSTYHNDGWGYIRKNYGSNCWYDSNIRQWLNSSGTVEYTHCPPTYSNEDGFMSNFSEAELACVKEVTQKTYVNSWETNRSGYVNGGTREVPDVTTVAGLDRDYSYYWYQNVTDSFFLLGQEQLSRIYENDPSYVYNDASYYTRIAGNSGASYEHTFVVFGENTIGASRSSSSNGIRPAFYLDIDKYNSSTNTPSTPQTCKHINSVNQPQINPNCIDIGFTAGVYCNDCATWLSGHEVIAVGDHKDNTGDGKCDTCLKQLSTPSEPEQPKKNIVQKVVDAVKNAFNNFINFFKKLFGR